MALDRAINGEREIIERDGYVAIERRKPCSDKLLIHLLATRERARVATRADRAEAHRLALAEARLAAIRAGAGAPRRKGARPQVPALPAPILPAMLDDAGADAAALHAFRGHAAAFAEWPSLEVPERPCLPAPWGGDGTTIAPADGVLVAHAGAACLSEPAWNELPPLRWEDFPVTASAGHRESHSG